jgi:hypothetical protein
MGKFYGRLVAQGFSHMYSVDYNKVFSPTLKLDSIRAMLAIRANEDLEIHLPYSKTKAFQELQAKAVLQSKLCEAQEYDLNVLPRRIDNHLIAVSQPFFVKQSPWSIL